MSRKRVKRVEAQEPAVRVSPIGARRELRAKTAGQQRLIDAVLENTITFVDGPAGSGKTHISVSLGVQALRRGDINKLILSRPILTACGEDIGALPGTMEEKLHPFLMPLFDELSYYIPPPEIKELMAKGIIEILPVAYMRGRTLKSAYILVDEAQNLLNEQIKLILTRIGERSKIIINGDTRQSDLSFSRQGGLADYMDILDGLDGIGMVELDNTDIVRHEIIGRILERIDKAYDPKKVTY